MISERWEFGKINLGDINNACGTKQLFPRFFINQKGRTSAFCLFG